MCRSRSLSEQNADRKCSWRNDSLHRRQTPTSSPFSLLLCRGRRLRSLGFCLPRKPCAENSWTVSGVRCLFATADGRPASRVGTLYPWLPSSSQFLFLFSCLCLAFTRTGGKPLRTDKSLTCRRLRELLRTVNMSNVAESNFVKILYLFAVLCKVLMSCKRIEEKKNPYKNTYL